MKGKKEPAAGKNDHSVKKTVLTTIAAALLAIVVVLIWKAVVTVDPYEYLTISFDGAKPYLIPKAVVAKDAPAGIRASDFIFSAEDDDNTVFSYEGQIFTVRFRKKNNLLRNRYYKRRTKTYKVGRTPDYVTEPDDMYDPNDHRVSAWDAMDKAVKKIMEQDGENYHSYVYQGMIVRMAPSYEADDKNHEAAYLIYSTNQDLPQSDDVVAVELYNVAVDGRCNLSYRKDAYRVWKEDSYKKLYDSIMAEYPDWDCAQDDEVNYEKLSGDQSRNL
ncbi:MAG: hypothetical protein ACI4CS_06130 [Candidatus Weimeria sp.]